MMEPTEVHFPPSERAVLLHALAAREALKETLLDSDAADYTEDAIEERLDRLEVSLASGRVMVSDVLTKQILRLAFEESTYFTDLGIDAGTAHEIGRMCALAYRLRRRLSMALQCPVALPADVG